MPTSPASPDSRACSHVDRAVLDGFRRLQRPGQPDVLSRIVASFLRVSPALLTDIRSAVEAADPEALRRAAHSMKSSNAQIGATRLAALCLELEQEGRNGELDGADAVLARLVKEYDCVEEELSRLLPETSTSPPQSDG